MLKDVSGHVLEIGDKVKMNIEVLKNGDLDGVEFTSTGENYWKYICSHPDEVMTLLKTILLNGLTQSNCNNKKPLPSWKGFLV